MALSFFKKKAEETSEGLRINMPGAEKVPLATSVPAVPVRTGHNPAAAAKGTDVLTGQAVTLSDTTVVPAGGTLVVEF